MFFEYLMSIRLNDLVLEIGPGAYPYWRSDCLVDKYDNHSSVDISQFGGAPQRTLGKPLFKIKNNIIPFKDKCFDYVICSHVLEHVPHNELIEFVSEIYRVGKKSYIEFPLLMYDYLYDINSHLNFMDIVDGEIICLSKEYTKISHMHNFTNYANAIRKENGFSVESPYASLMAVGMEFSSSIPVRILYNESDFFQCISAKKTFVQDVSIGWLVKANLLRLTRVLNREKSPKFFEHMLR